MNRKTLLAAAAALVVTASCVACSGRSNTPGPDSATSSTTTAAITTAPPTSSSLKPAVPQQVGGATLAPARTLPPCPEYSGGAVAIELGAHRNAPNPANLPTPVTAMLGTAVDAGEQISVISGDGAPKLVGTSSFAPKGRNGEQRKSERAAFLTGLNAALTAGVKPATAQADPLRALALTARAAGSSGPRTLVMSDSLIATVGALNLTEPGMLYAAPGEVVNYLARAQAIPDLTGMNLILYGAGDTAPPQSQLDGAARAGLLAIWAAIVAAGHADCLTVLDTPNSATPAVGDDAPAVDPVVLAPPPAWTPPVTTVTATSTAVVTTTKSVTTTVVPPAPPAGCSAGRQPSGTSSICLPDDATFGFIEGQADLRNPSAAAQGLRAMATWLAADHRHHHAQLTGTTARWGSKEYQTDLATRRAEAIKTLLVRGGASADQITTQGFGSYWPGYIQDSDADGNLLPGPANANRSVLISTSIT